MNIETLKLLKRSFILMIIWPLVGEILTLTAFDFRVAEIQPGTFALPFAGLNFFVVGIVSIFFRSFLEIFEPLFWPTVVMGWMFFLLLPVFSSKLRKHKVATLRLQVIFSILQCVLGLIALVGSAC